MQLNISTCYAMQMMVYITRNKRIVSSAELSEKLKISQRYVLQLAAKLRDGGLLSTYAGVNGGYVLGKEMSTISAYNVLSIMEGDMSIPDCLTKLSGCGEPCSKRCL